MELLYLIIVIMQRPHRAGIGVLSAQITPNLGKIRRRSLPLLEPGDVLLSLSMISHPLAYVATHPRHLAPTMGQGAPSSRDLFWTGTLFLLGEHSEPDTPDGVCADALHGAEVVCAASCLADTSPTCL